MARPSRVADFGERRALVEHSKFARRRSRRHSAGHPKDHATATMVLATFAETKVARLAGRTPALKDIKKVPVHFVDTAHPCPGKQPWDPQAGPAQMSSTLKIHDCKT